MLKTVQKYARKFLGIEDSGTPWVTLSGGVDRKQAGNGFVDAVTRAIVNAVCNGELRLHKADGSVIQYERKGKNKLLDLLYQPSPFFNLNVFLQIWTSQQLAFGNTYILKDARDSRGLPTRLIPVPAPCVTIKYTSGGYPEYYDVYTTNGHLHVPLEDMIHVYEGNAVNLFEGQSRLQKCRMDADIMNAAKVFNLAFFQNGASVGGVIQYPQGSNVPREDMQNALRFFNDMHQGAAKAHRTAILTKGGTYESFKTSHKDMEYGEGQKFHQQQILSISGVPPALVGLFEFAPQFNTKEQQKIFYETTVIPLVRLLSDALSEELVPEFYPQEQVYIDFDFSKVKALEPDWKALGEAASLLAQKWPLNEVRDALGLPFSDVAGGDEPPDPVLSAFALEAPKTEIKAVKRTRLVRPTPAQLKRHKAQKLALIKEQGEVMRKSIGSHFDGQAAAVQAWVKANEDRLFDYDAVFGSRKDQEMLLLSVKVPALADIFSAAISFEQNYLQSLAPQKDFQFTDKKALQDRVAAWAQEHAFKWAGSIERTTWERLDKIIKLGVERGMSNRDINNIVLQFFSEEGYEPSMLTPNENGARISIKNRVDTIVQTETLSTISEAQLEAYRATPFVNGKGWITTMGVSDHHEGHLEMDGQEVRIDQDFTNPVTGQKTTAPGQFGTADQDINCLCDTYPIVLDEE